MKNYKKNIFIVVVLFFLTSTTKAQTNNWARLDSVGHIARVSVGLDYGLVYGLNYGKVIKKNKIIWIPFADISLPLGSAAFNDYKFKMGTALKFLQFKSWILTTDISVINRQNTNPFVRMQNLGYEFGFQFGLYKPKWFLNVNFFTDNSFLTHLNHTDAYKGNYSEVVDGWYQNTSNNIQVGFTTGVSFKRSEINLKLGQIFTQSFSAKPSLPLYFQLGYNYKFANKQK